MLLQVLLVCFLGNVLLVESTSHVIADVIRPRSLLPEAHDATIRSFWTLERLKAAKPIDRILSSSKSATTSNNSNVTTGPPSSIPGSSPSNNGTIIKAISSRGQQVYTTGRVFWQSGTTLWSCSASVIISNSKDLISTAGHCVYDTDAKAWYNNNNWVFVPAYSNNNAPYGIWPARRFLISQAWTSANFNYDVAFVALSTVNKNHIQSIVGAQGIGFNQPRSAYTYSFGYPSNIGSGLYLESCVGYTRPSPYQQNNYIGQGLPCNMGHGCSGGPWLQNVVDTTGLGYVTSVNSFTVSNVANVMNGPYFESNIKTLYDQATSM